MPCQVDYPDDGSEEKRWKDLQNIADNVTRMLCEMCARLEAENLTHLLTAPTKEWWEEHKKIDAERIAREERKQKIASDRKALRKSALGKLTPEERKVLGIKKKKSAKK